MSHKQERPERQLHEAKAVSVIVYCIALLVVLQWLSWAGF